MGENLAREVLEAHLARLDDLDDLDNLDNLDDLDDLDGKFIATSRIDGCELIDEYIHDHSEWSITWLHVYRHPGGDVIGVLDERGSGRYQDDCDYRPVLVDVEVDPRPRYLAQR